MSIQQPPVSHKLYIHRTYSASDTVTEVSWHHFGDTGKHPSALVWDGPDEGICEVVLSAVSLLCLFRAGVKPVAVNLLLGEEGASILHRCNTQDYAC